MSLGSLPASDSSNRPHVLVADDDPAVRRLIVRALNAAGFEVSEAADGRTAAQLVAQTAFAAVVTDVTMPGVRGTDLALLRSRESTRPHAGAVLEAAERLGRLDDIGRAVRDIAPAPMVNAPAPALLFVNLHARDLADEALVRDVDKDPVKQKVIRSVTRLCGEMGISVVAEGIETPEERTSVIDLGCSLLQGYLLSRPGVPFPEVAW